MCCGYLDLVTRNLVKKNSGVMDDLSLILMSNRTNGTLYFQCGMIEMEFVITCSNSILVEEKSCCMRNSNGGIALGLLANFAANCWLKTEIYVGLFGFEFKSIIHRELFFRKLIES